MPEFNSKSISSIIELLNIHTVFFLNIYSRTSLKVYAEKGTVSIEHSLRPSHIQN